MPQQQPLDEPSVCVNGEDHRLPAGCTIAGLLVQLGMAGRRVAVAVNHAVVPRSTHAEVVLCDGDDIEILEAVGGG